MRLFGYHVRRMTVFLCLLEGTIFGAAFLSVSQFLAQPAGLPMSLETFLEVAVAPAGLLFLTMVAFGAYNIDMMQSARIVTPRLIAAAVLGGAALIFVIATGMTDQLSPVQMVMAEAAAFPLILLGRMGLRHLTVVPVLRSRALVLGTGNRAQRVWEVLSGDRLGRLAGFVEVDTSSGEHPLVPTARVLPRTESLAVMARASNVDQVVIALEDQRGTLPMEELLECRMQGITVHNASTFLERETGKVDLDAMRPSWLVFDEDFTSGRVSDFCKRSLDLVASAGLLLLLAPVLLITALLIKLDSPGPVFYRQVRVGLGGKPYSIIKFRSMRNAAEKDGKAQWAQAGDPRVTRVGSILRKSRIDEIPQALNVLSGDMSFVGPRPERPAFVSDLAEEIPYYNERHRVKPGITGWAQINYPYGASVEDARQKLRYDLYYIKNKSLLFDLIVMLQTVRIILFAEGSR